MSDSTAQCAQTENSLEELEVRLTRALGAVVGGGTLSRALGYQTQGAFRQSLARNRVPVPVFTLEGRRGRYALTADIARWLWSQRAEDDASVTRVPGKEAIPEPSR